MTVQEILDMPIEDIEQLSVTDLKKITTQLASAANKRVKRNKEKGVYSKAVSGAEEFHGKFTVKGKDSKKEVLQEFNKTKTFLNYKTSTLKGAREVMKAYKDVIGTSLTPKQEKRLWRVYNRIKEMYPNILYGAGHYNTEQGKDLQRTISEEISKHKGYGIDRMTKLISERLEREYNEQEELYDNTDFYGVKRDL